MGAIEKMTEDAILFAKWKHPVWPEDAIHAAALITEELGELVQAANDFMRPGEGNVNRNLRERMEEEALHVAATAYRFLENLDRY